MEGGEGGRGEGRRHSKKVGCTTICQKRWPLDLEKLKRYLYIKTYLSTASDSSEPKPHTYSTNEGTDEGSNYSVR